MSTLSDRVEISRRFARSARLDADLEGTPPLVGYVLQASAATALKTLAASQIESQQGAFTWTGPYGGGKSSAALLVANLIGGAGENRAIARGIAGEEIRRCFDAAFPDALGRWSVVAVTGSRVGLRGAIADACAVPLGWSRKTLGRARAEDAALVQALLASATGERGGVALILDELGKFLEHAAVEGGDIHVLQDLAEFSARSAGRLVVIGILHQAFDQYAARVARDARQEWAKVQGRYQDIPFLAAADETVSLLGRAISTTERPRSARHWAENVARAVGKRRPIEEAALAQALEATWPLNPVTALLLGPVSRQRFAQNERSVFGFLGSAEPAGFQEHLKATPVGSVCETYNPDRLWDYLAANFGMALLGGHDGARFSLAFEAIDRASAKGGALHVAVTKCAAMVEFFRNSSGLAVADDVIATCVPHVAAEALRAVVDDLVDWAVLIRQPRLGGYALFAGSDFDLEDAISKATVPLGAEQIAVAPQRVGLGFAAAKRHYSRTGALRTFEVMLQTAGASIAVEGHLNALRGRNLRNGAIILLVSDGSLSGQELERCSKQLAKALGRAGMVAAVGAAPNSFGLRAAAAELFAVERVLREHPQVEGDRIARREIAARRSGCVDALHRALEDALNGARWWLAPDPSHCVREPLSFLASALADAAFAQTPILKSELLQRDKPSSNAAAALRELCHAMVERGHERDLGFVGFPAEMGLYLTVLKPFGLHRDVGLGHHAFTSPDLVGLGASLQPAWAVMDAAGDVSLQDVYDRWSTAPIGMKAGPMPVIALAHILARRDRLAVYVGGVFQTALDTVFVDRLLQKPADVRLRHIDRSIRETTFLDSLARHFGLVGEVTALNVAQTLFRRFEELPSYAQRTDTLGEVARKVRTVVLRASDPEALLFQHLPEVLGDELTADAVLAALLEAEAAYGELLDRMREALGRALGTDAVTFEGLAARAASIEGLTNDFAFEAFAMRAAAFDGGAGDIEGLASLLLHRPPHQWSDRDREQALIELARSGRRFRELEALAVVRNRRSSSEALALIVGVEPSTQPVLRSFVLSEAEARVADRLADRVLGVFSGEPSLDRVQLAALARAVASLAARSESDEGVSDTEAA